MTRVYCDGSVVYDSQQAGTELTGLTADVMVNKGGSAVIQLPPGHPSYDIFREYRSIVTIWRDNALIFRGRALQSSKSWNNEKVITCEGERCFFRDATMRPYLYQTDPESIWRAVVDTYNSQVEAWKWFTPGVCTVTDPNGYIRFESEDAELCPDTLDKLVERCGGYITFTGTEGRTINWLASLTDISGQVIQFGDNLLDLNRAVQNPDLVTGIIPYGAKNENTGERVTIESVNNGLDYIINEEARLARGTILQPVVFDDITEPVNLLAKAWQYLASASLMITSLELSAIDLSVLDGGIDALEIGRRVRVLSLAHGIDEILLMTSRHYDFLHPEQDTISIGAEAYLLTTSVAKRKSIVQL